MINYNQKIKVKAIYEVAAKDFLAFLQVVGKKNERSINIRYKYLGRGKFNVVVSGESGDIDIFFQELILNKGLYYYICTIRGSEKREARNQVVIPIFQGLLEGRFENPYSHFLRRQLTGKNIDQKCIPGDFKNHFAHQYEILFGKWSIGSLGDRSFIMDLDALLTQFMLTNLHHIPGRKSPQFTVLVDQAYRSGLGMISDVKGQFNKIHKMRTDGLHRLGVGPDKEIISELAFQIYNYFQYYDGFEDSQKIKTEKLHGKRYRRIKYGDEKWDYEREKDDPTWEEIVQTPCHDCSAIQGQYHCEGCDVEQCPRCGNQFLGCSCKLAKDYD